MLKIFTRRRDEKLFFSLLFFMLLQQLKYLFFSIFYKVQKKSSSKVEREFNMNVIDAASWYNLYLLWKIIIYVKHVVSESAAFMFSRQILKL